MSVKIIKNYRDYRDQQKSVKERKECMPEEDNYETKGQEGQEEPTQEKEPTEESNKGKLLVDAKCALADITYPTDAGRLNNAREKTEKIKDTVYMNVKEIMKKPRTYRKKAREHLTFMKL